MEQIDEDQKPILLVKRKSLLKIPDKKIDENSVEKYSGRTKYS